jgi:hypothetical protein
MALLKGPVLPVAYFERNKCLLFRQRGHYCGGVTTVVVVEVDAGGETGSVVVVVRLTVVVVEVGGGGVDTTSSLVHALKQAAAPTIKSIRSEVFIFINKLRNRSLRRISGSSIGKVRAGRFRFHL